MDGEKYQFDFFNFNYHETGFMTDLSLNNAYVELYKTRLKQQDDVHEEDDKSTQPFASPTSSVDSISKKRKYSSSESGSFAAQTSINSKVKKRNLSSSGESGKKIRG